MIAVVVEGRDFFYAKCTDPKCRRIGGYSWASYAQQTFDEAQAVADQHNKEKHRTVILYFEEDPKKFWELAEEHSKRV